MRVAALELAVRRLADVVQQARALGEVGVEADLAREHRGDERRLHRVVEHVLVVGKAEFQPAEQLDDLVVQAVDVELRHRLLARLRGRQVDLLLRPLHEFLDRRRVDAPVLHQGLQRHARDLAAHRVERGQHHHLRRLVDQHGDARGGLERLDVAALAADDAALHFLAWQRDQRGRQVVVRLAREPLHRGDENPARIGLQLLLGLLQGLPAQHAQLVLALKQDLLAERAADFLGVHLRDAFEALAHAFRQGAHRVPRLPHRGVLPIEALLLLLELVVEQRQRFLVRPDFTEPHIGLDLAPVEFPVGLGALLLDLRLGLLLHLLGRDCRLAARDLGQLGRLLVRHAPRVAGQRPDDQEADAPANHQRDRQRPVTRFALGKGEQQGKRRGVDGNQRTRTLTGARSEVQSFFRAGTRGSASVCHCEKPAQRATK